jgi:UDP-N-acetylglucosamine 1-carboxyvinyltransferase
MSKFVINGGRTLSGVVDVAANKNAVLPMMAAAVLTDEDVILDNVPRIADVATMVEILTEMGAQVEFLTESRLRINCADVRSYRPSAQLVERLRASIVLLGPLLARFGRAEMHHPGGDAIGTRSIGTHIMALEEMGATFVVDDNFYRATIGPNGEDHYVFLDETSVTATENAMLLAARRCGCTTIANAASEPHIENLGVLLQSMGARIDGLGSNLLRVRGKQQLGAGCAPVWPDHIEVGTFAALAAACGDEVVIRNVVPSHLDMVLIVLQRMGVDVAFVEGNLVVRRAPLHAIDKLRTGVWPSFPTDLASIYIVLATQAQGMTLVHDWMYEARMYFVDRLVQMGARIVLADPHRAVISGPSSLRGREFVSPDIRAGIALVMGALIATGRSEIDHIELIDRGYERIDERLRALGADIQRVD